MSNKNENIYDYQKVEQALEDYYGKKFSVDKITAEEEPLLSEENFDEDSYESDDE